MIIGGDHGVVVIDHLGGEREKEILDHARVGTDTEVPVAGYDGPLTIQGGGWRLGDPGDREVSNQATGDIAGPEQNRYGCLEQDMMVP